MLHHHLPASRAKVLQYLVNLSAFCAIGAGMLAPVAAQTGSSGTSASQGDKPGSASTQWGLGLGGGVFQQPYQGVDNKKRALPLLYVENSWLRIAGPSADLKLANWHGGYGSIELAARLKYEGVGYEASDSPALAGMDERKESFWAGGAASWKTPLAQLSAEWIADASGNSKGQQLQLQVDRRFSFGAFALTPRVQAQWLDKKYVDYYYGVKAREALPGRSQYSGKAATALGAGLRADYQLQARQAIFMDLAVTSLPDETKNSPIAGRSSVSHVSAGYLYRF